MTADLGRSDGRRDDGREPEVPVRLSPDADNELERASWQDWQRTFNDRILANLFRRTAEGT